MLMSPYNPLLIIKSNLGNTKTTLKQPFAESREYAPFENRFLWQGNTESHCKSNKHDAQHNEEILHVFDDLSYHAYQRSE
jgi:hypothetical protein